jgi:hypothetical protein
MTESDLKNGFVGRKKFESFAVLPIHCSANFVRHLRRFPADVERETTKGRLAKRNKAARGSGKEMIEPAQPAAEEKMKSFSFVFTYMDRVAGSRDIPIVVTASGFTTAFAKAGRLFWAQLDRKQHFDAASGVVKVSLAPVTKEEEKNP